MSIELITIRELLRDPQYKAYFTKVPKLPDHYTPANLPWKLMILKRDEHVWRSKRMGTYQEAFAGLKKMLPLIDNAAINCPPLGFMPPIKRVRLKGKYDRKNRQIIKTIVWKPSVSSDIEPHYWCAHCRRPSIFHIAVTAPRSRGGIWMPSSSPAMRCIICGAPDTIMNLREPERAQLWDSERIRIS